MFQTLGNSISRRWPFFMLAWISSSSVLPTPTQPNLNNSTERRVAWGMASNNESTGSTTGPAIFLRRPTSRERNPEISSEDNGHVDHGDFQQKVTLGLAGIIALLTGNAVLSCQNVQRLDEDARWVAHTHEVMDRLEEVHGQLLQAEVVQRTYLITGGEAFPPFFDESIVAAKQKLHQVKLLTGDNPDQQARIPEVEKRLEELAGIWSNIMSLRRDKGFPATRQAILTGEGAQTLNELQALIQQMEDAERMLLRERQVRTDHSYGVALVTGFVSAVTGVLAVAMFFWLLQRHLRGRHQAESLIHEQRQLLQATLASIGDGVLTTDAKGRVIFLNEVAQRLTGWSLDEAVGRPSEEVFHIVNEDTRKPVENPAMRALGEGKIVGLANHTILIAKDGREWPLDDSAAPIRDERGAVSGAVLVFREVLERRHLERENASRLSAARLLSAVVESSEDLIITKKLDGIIQSWNSAAERVLGYTAEEAVGRHITLIIPHDRIAEEEQIIARLRAGERVKHFETVRRGKDGRLIPVALTISPIKDETGKVIGASKIARDITDKRAAESALRSSEERLSLAVNATGLGLWDWDVRTNEVIWNTHHETIFGYAPGRSKRSYRDFADRLLPEDLEQIEAGFRRAMQEKSEYRFEHRVIWPNGVTRWVEAFGRFHFDASGQAIRSVGVVMDVTHRKEGEQALREADRRKDEFLATLAHELRNPLAPIRNGLEAMRIAGNDNRPAIEQVQTMMDRQLTQLVRLVDDLMDVSRISRGKIELRREHLQLTTVIQSAIETSRPLIEKMGHKLAVTLPKESVVVDADLTRLAQVFLNLLNNAAKYTEQGGHIWLIAQLQGNEVAISVKDTGVGIAADQLPRLFTMFSQLDHSLDGEE